MPHRGGVLIAMFLVFAFANSFSLLEIFVVPLAGSNSIHVSQAVYLISGVIGVLGTYLFYKY